MVSARSGGDFSFTLTDWGEGLRPYDFEMPYGYERRETKVHTIFDRMLVRQGETIHMKHLVRKPAGGQGFTVPAAFDGTLTPVAPRLRHAVRAAAVSQRRAASARPNGPHPPAAPMGDYDLQVVRWRRHHALHRPVVQGRRIQAAHHARERVRAEGGGGPARSRCRSTCSSAICPAAARPTCPVDLRVGWFAHSRTPDGYEGYTFGGAGGGGGRRARSTARAATRPCRCRRRRRCPSRLRGDGTQRSRSTSPRWTSFADMRVEMDYRDANGEVLTASRTIPIHPAAVQLGMRTDGWMMKQDDLRLRFVALDTDGKPIKGQRVEVALYSRQILTARRRLIGGFYAYDNQMRTTKLDATCSATTDAQGLAQCAIDPGVSGEVYAVATAKDADGNVARAVRSVWLAGDEDWWFGGDNGDRMDLVPEQTGYAAGETARFQVRMPFRAATALVTVEREGVLASYVTELSGTDPVVEVKMPGVLRARRLRLGAGGARARGARLLVVAARRRAQARPGQRPRSGAAADRARRPEQARLPLGIAKVKVGWEGHRLQVAVKADRERYAARDTAQVAVQVRNPDGTPAKSADVAFVAVDQAILQLAPNDSWDVLTAMMGERPLSVLTSTAQMQVVGKRHYGRKAVEAGGGGGDATALNRENFQPVLLWRGHAAARRAGSCARVACRCRTR